MMEITATLEQWHQLPNGSITGLIHGDIHGRWPDGTTIWTSTVKEIVDNIAYTRNSVYELGEPYKGSDK